MDCRWRHRNAIHRNIPNEFLGYSMESLPWINQSCIQSGNDESSVSLKLLNIRWKQMCCKWSNNCCYPSGQSMSKSLSSSFTKLFSILFRVGDIISAEHWQIEKKESRMKMLRRGDGGGGTGSGSGSGGSGSGSGGCENAPWPWPQPGRAIYDASFESFTEILSRFSIRFDNYWLTSLWISCWLDIPWNWDSPPFHSLAAAVERKSQANFEGQGGRGRSLRSQRYLAPVPETIQQQKKTPDTSAHIRKLTSVGRRWAAR